MEWIIALVIFGLLYWAASVGDKYSTPDRRKRKRRLDDELPRINQG